MTKKDFRLMAAGTLGGDLVIHNKNGKITVPQSCIEPFSGLIKSQVITAIKNMNESELIGYGVTVG